VSGEAAFSLRQYRAADEDAAVALWLRTWQAAYPDLDFAARLGWWRARWRDELVAAARIVIAQARGGADTAMIGFVTVDPAMRYLDQLVVAPDFWRLGVGTALLEEARRLSPAGLDLDVNTDNTRAIGFYRRRGFDISGAGQNPISGKPVYRMRWRP
jgi:putative acetyltransferase